MTDSTVVLPSPQRWDQPFDPDMRDEDVQRVLSMSPFSIIDADRFPEHISLHDIIKNDAAIRNYRSGDIIVREGDYGSSAFFILSGSVQVVLSPSLPAHMLGRREPEVKGLWGALSQLWKNSINPEQRDPKNYLNDGQGIHTESATDSLVSLKNIDKIMNTHQTAQLGRGDMFGEIAALSRTSRGATVFAENEVEVLELQWEGLRDIRNKSDEFRTFIDERYRERSLKLHLIESPLFSHLDNEHLSQIVNATQFETYGNFNWYAPFKSMVEKSGGDPLEQEPIIAREGHYVNGLILIRSGFARQSQKLNHGHRTISYMGRGDMYGLHELVNNWTSARHVPNQSSLSAMGYVDVLRIPTAIIEEYVLPQLPEEQLDSIKQANKLAMSDKEQAVKMGRNDGFLEFLVENRFINGTQSMLIDLDRCTRCDDCVRACTVAHDNNPRFIRHGKRHDNIMVANSCMHCTDPVCMIGCPTGAIHRDAYQGQVVINDNSCIGCGSCAASCPYNNIRLVEIRDSKGNFIINESTQAPVLKATKCDLCIDQQVSPSCERACPHDAMIRINMCDTEKLNAWLSR